LEVPDQTSRVGRKGFRLRTVRAIQAEEEDRQVIAIYMQPPVADKVTTGEIRIAEDKASLPVTVPPCKALVLGECSQGAKDNSPAVTQEIVEVGEDEKAVVTGR